MYKLKNRRLFLSVLIPALISFLFIGCAFVPKQVDISSSKQRITYPRETYTPAYEIELGPFVDSRSNKKKLGVARNKLMMVTTSVSIACDLDVLFREMVTQNLAVYGIGNGESSLRLQGEVLDASTDAVGPNHIYVEVTTSLTLIDAKNNIPIFHKMLKGREVTPVTQVSNLAWENAFIGAMNKINEQIHNVALEISNLLKANQHFEPVTSTGSCVIVHPSGGF